MILGLTLSLALQTRSISVEEFFPMKPGTVWRFEEKSGRSRFEVVEIANPVMRVGEVEATPIETRIQGQLAETLYYRIQDNRVLMVAIDPRKPFEPPYPVVVGANTDRATWNFETTTNYTPEPSPHRLQGEAKLGRSARVLGQSVETLEVKLTGTIGVDGPGQVRTERIARYGKGIGLIEAKDTTVMGSQKQVRERKLIGFTLPKGSSH